MLSNFDPLPPNTMSQMNLPSHSRPCPMDTSSSDNIPLLLSSSVNSNGGQAMPSAGGANGQPSVIVPAGASAAGGGGDVAVGPSGTSNTSPRAFSVASIGGGVTPHQYSAFTHAGGVASSSMSTSVSPSNQIVFSELNSPSPTPAPTPGTLMASSSKRYLYCSDRHSAELLSAVSVLRHRRELCDVVLVVGSRRIYAHRVILAGYSTYFLAMFTGELAESRQTEIKINDIDEHAMELLIDFAYTSRIIIEESNVQVLLPAACLLQMIEIQEVCCEFLKRELDPSNCLGIRSFADTHACKDLLLYADKYTQDNFQDVIENEEFLLLPVTQMIDIISSDELNVTTEEQVYHAIMAWVRYSVAERAPHLSNVLLHVRLSQLSAKFLVGTVSSDMLIKNDNSCRELVDEAKNYLLLPTERTHMVGPRFRPRKPIRRGEVLFAAGGWCSGDAIASVERFDPMSKEWRMVAPMTKRRCGVGCAVLNDLLYAVGGHDGQSYLNSIERYDPYLNSWCTDVAPTSTSRTSVGVGVLDGFLYAVGGQDGVQCLNIVERYEPSTNRWSKMANMNTRRLGVAVAVLGGYLYAIGGSDGTSPLNTVERYDPRTNRWTPMAPMWTRRKHLGCAVYNSLIYAVGGRDDTTELNSAERYNPQTNTWQPIVSMTSRRSGVGLAVVNGQLYAVGGFDGQTYLKTTEVLHFDEGQWNLCGSMNYRRLGGGVGVISLNNAPPVPELINSVKH